MPAFSFLRSLQLLEMNKEQILHSEQNKRVSEESVKEARSGGGEQKNIN